MAFYLTTLIYGLAAVALMSTWLKGFPSDMVHVDFIIAAVAAVSFYQEWRRAVPALIFYGILMDMASRGPFGISIISYLAIYGFIRGVITKISFQGGVALIVWVSIISLVDKFVTSAILLAMTGQFTIPKIVMQYAPFQVLLDAFLASALIPLIKWSSELSWEKITRPKGLVLR